ncbi:MAG TPA: hypothetical protein DHW15_10040 [Bacteroidetes bacterium]|jgi:hypothetical protein|nr:MAG: hypothetical protein ABR94_00820 [Sphingobacteriales bacterium BACL12 MAG-120802-bin5]KRP06803.1 MAG: hypothetical protein ABR95_08090 [Sphingobacteriales bacterium BACL12 MAG-120813-bin55]HCK22479.1 hypothetical protein [Bacteroidota bacterium]
MEWLFHLFASPAMLLLFTLGGLGIIATAMAWWFKKTADKSLSARDAEWDIVAPSRGKKKPRTFKERGNR